MYIVLASFPGLARSSLAVRNSLSQTLSADVKTLLRHTSRDERAPPSARIFVLQAMNAQGLGTRLVPFWNYQYSSQRAEIVYLNHRFQSTKPNLPRFVLHKITTKMPQPWKRKWSELFDHGRWTQDIHQYCIILYIFCLSFSVVCTWGILPVNY